MKRRLQYLDAARGLAIFTVVYSHICLFCLPSYDSSAVIDFLRSYFLNAFFFISGFVAYKTTDSLTDSLVSLFTKKAWQLLLPTIIVGTVYALSHHIEILRFYTDAAKYGYWFTIVLFEMYAIYFIILGITSIISYRYFQAILLTFIAIVFYWLHKNVIANTQIQNVLCLGSLSYYMPFFCLGILCNMFKPLISKVKEVGGGIFITLIFAIVVLGYILPVPMLISNIAIVVIMIWAIKSLYHSKKSGPITSKILMGLEALGRNTLEIYFLHYFILFPIPVVVGEYFSKLSTGHQSLSTPEFVIIGTVVIIICVICIVFARLLKTIPYISLLAFGKTTSK